MMVGFRGRPNVGLLLSDDERRYVERLVRSLGFMNIPWASGGGGFRLIVLRALWMTPVLAVHARFPMQRWRG